MRMDSHLARPSEQHRFHPLGDVLRFRDHALDLCLDGMRSADRVRYQLGPFRAYLLNRVEDIEHVLVKNHSNYVKGMNYETLKLTLGEGLLTSEGEVWRNNRKMMQPAFHRKSLESFVTTMHRCTQDMLRNWGSSPANFDIHSEMVRLTFRIVGLTLFSAEVEDEAEHVGSALAFLLDWSNRRIASAIRPPLWLPTPGNRQFHAALNRFDTLVETIIKERIRDGSDNGDLLDLMLAADTQPSLRQLRDELITLGAAGHETTANALSWTFMLIAQHPEVAERLAAEAETLGDSVELKDLERLEFTTQVVEESMRLYPPAWAFERQAVHEDELGGTKIKPKDFAMIIPYSLHRDPRYWDDPERFDPSRFTPEAKQERPRFAYLPFGGGPRVCIGKAFAMMEAKLIVASVMRMFRLEHDTSAGPVEMIASITLRPKDGLLMRRQPRAQRPTPIAEKPARGEPALCP